jgi:hypothetical protein
MLINGTKVCSSDAIYGAVSPKGTGGDMSEMAGHGHRLKSRTMSGEQALSASPDPTLWETITNMTSCEVVEVKKGDIVKIQAHYDLKKHPARQHADGGMAEEMAILGGSFFNLPV